MCDSHCEVETTPYRICIVKKMEQSHSVFQTIHCTQINAQFLKKIICIQASPECKPRKYGNYRQNQQKHLQANSSITVINNNPENRINADKQMSKIFRTTKSRSSTEFTEDDSPTRPDMTSSSKTKAAVSSCGFL